jgi:predicted CxxxxCH...CXXCH cytochrome family protein
MRAGLHADRSSSSSSWAGALAISLWIGGLSCTIQRDRTPPPPVYLAEVGPVLQQRCLPCHDGPSAEGGWRAGSFLDAIACVSSGAAANAPAGTEAPIVSALGTDAHRGVVNDAEKALIVAWIGAGTPAFRGTVHAPGIVDPRSDAWHGKLLRSRGWRPMLDADDAEACGRCHDGSPARPPRVTSPAPGATACTQCHAAPQGVLACGTCHGTDARAYPPRDPCFFPEDAARAGAHAAHVAASSTRPSIACATCHPIPGKDVIGGVHGNGSVEVIFDTARFGPEASHDRATGACAVSCHDRGGARPHPRWTESGPMQCGDCHSSPPASHFSGACTTCHRHANATGTELSAGMLHLNGKVDLGDGSGGCGACHGKGDDPWPSTGAHASHRTPLLASSVECSTCHAVPQTILAGGHMDGTVQVVFSGRAIARNAQAAWDGRACSEVACHGALLDDVPAVTPVWADTTGAARACGACHGIPPSQHTASTSCDRSTCHGSEIDRTFTTLAVSATGKALHVNGVIDTAAP